MLQKLFSPLLPWRKSMYQWDSYSESVFENLISTIVLQWLSRTRDRVQMLQQDCYFLRASNISFASYLFCILQILGEIKDGEAIPKTRPCCMCRVGIYKYFLVVFNNAWLIMSSLLRYYSFTEISFI